jgi:hypothetical protein
MDENQAKLGKDVGYSRTFSNIKLPYEVIYVAIVARKLFVSTQQ